MSFFRKKWKMHLYLNGIYVGKVKIKAEDKPSENTYIARFWFKKQIFKSNYVKSLIHPTKVIMTDDKRKITYWQFEYAEGVEV